ncbi:hypothetical protein [Aulosira sp. FACHB-615]|uniref:hypothetical protein n=1 Tax=Aulosira sp. FACHB-615 TaxID=2692777 RepID=UPI0016869D8A|nr:hypothetical protein [Aulosira sp. FACHB-615]MBD2492675.1 hypothetical protein [Aulosira sp. FACHB-615]
MNFWTTSCLSSLPSLELIHYREAILQDKPANCLRYAIAADLTQPWSHLLLQQGFDINITHLHFG